MRKLKTGHMPSSAEDSSYNEGSFNRRSFSRNILPYIAGVFIGLMGIVVILGDNIAYHLYIRHVISSGQVNVHVKLQSLSAVRAIFDVAVFVVLSTIFIKVHKRSSGFSGKAVWILIAVASFTALSLTYLFQQIEMFRIEGVHLDLKNVITIFFSLSFFQGMSGMVGIIFTILLFLWMVGIYKKNTGRNGLPSMIYFLCISLGIGIVTSIFIFIFIMAFNMNSGLHYINFIRVFELFMFQMKSPEYRKMVFNNAFLMRTLITFIIGILLIVESRKENREEMVV